MKNSWRKQILFLVKQFFKMGMQHIILPLSYSFYSKKPICKGLVLFVDSHHNEIPFSMEYLKKELEQNKKFRIETAFEDFNQYNPITMMIKMTALMKRYAIANYVVICDNCMPISSCNKREDTYVIQLWHGCGAYKKFGYDTDDDIPSYYKGNVFKNYDLVTVSGSACRKPFSTAMKQDIEKVQSIGVSRTDFFFDKDYIKRCKEKFEKCCPQDKDKKIVLIAPTFRGHAGDRDEMDYHFVDDMKKEFCDQGVFVLKVHPHMEKYFDVESIPMTTEELLCVADILVTDYSSIVFEYALFKKPIIYYMPDKEQYLRKRGFYLKMEELPGRIVEDSQELMNQIKRLLESNAVVSKEYDAFLKTYMGECDGKATKRIVECMEAIIETSI